jgi:hypothetical protein
MFYIHGKFGRNRMKIKEGEAYWCFACIFDMRVAAFFTYSMWSSPMPVNRIDGLETH